MKKVQIKAWVRKDLARVIIKARVIALRKLFKN